jgi:peptide/nickel transport system substrate-binding protein
MNRSKWLMIVAVLALAMSACGGATKGPGATTGTSAQPTAGGTLRLAMLSDVQAAFDPAKEYYTLSSEFFRCCLLRTLLSTNGLSTEQGGAELHPDLAADMPTMSSDGLTWTFTLKPDVHYGPPFGDTVVTAQDFIRAMEREADPDASTNGYAFYYSAIEGFDAFRDGRAEEITGLEAPDTTTLVVHLTEPTGDFGYRMAQAAAAPIPPDAENEPLGAAEGHTRDYGRFLVATGPYMFEGSEDLDFSLPVDQQTPVAGNVPSRSYILVRNPSYDPATDGLRMAYADEIDVGVGGDVQDLYNKVMTNDLDLVIDGVAPPQVLRQYATDPTLKQYLHVDPSDAIRYLSMNLAVPPFDDIHVRKAVNLVVDKDGMRKLRGGVLMGALAGHVMVDSLENNLLEGYDPYASPNGAGDVTAAKGEMAQSKYDINGDGVCDDPVCDAVVTVTDTQPPYPEQAALLKENLAQIGLTLDVKALERSTMYNRVNDPSNHVAFFVGGGWGKDYPDGLTFTVPLFDSSAIYPSCCNNSLLGATAQQLAKWHYAVTDVPSVDADLQACGATLGDERFRCYADVDKKLMEQIVPWVPWLFDNEVDITSTRITSYSFDQWAGTSSYDRLALMPSA